MLQLNFYRYRWSWILGAVWVLAMGLVHLSASNSTSLQSVQGAPDSAYEGMHRLLLEEQKINPDWLNKARQWPGASPLPNDSAKVVEGTWLVLREDAQALQKYAGNVLQKDRIIKVGRLLAPYLRNSHTETRQLAEQMDERIQSLLALSRPDDGSPVMLLTWLSLDRVTQDLDRVQALLVEFRRISLTSATPVEARFSLSLFHQF